MRGEDITEGTTEMALQHLPRGSTCMRAVTRGGHAYTATLDVTMPQEV